MCLNTVPYSKHNFGCRFSNNTGPSSVSFFIRVDLCKNQGVNERLCRGFGLMSPEIRSLYGQDLIHLTSYINLMCVWSTEALLRCFCGMKNDTELLVDPSFLMYIPMYQVTHKKVHLILVICYPNYNVKVPKELDIKKGRCMNGNLSGEFSI